MIDINDIAYTFVVLFFKLLGRIPRRWARRVSGFLGALWFAVDKRHRQMALGNRVLLGECVEFIVSKAGVTANVTAFSHEFNRLGRDVLFASCLDLIFRLVDIIFSVVFQRVLNMLRTDMVGERGLVTKIAG